MSKKITGAKKVSGHTDTGEEAQHPENSGIDQLVRTAVILAIAGMLLVLVFLIAGFQAWSVGFGVFLGMPVMLLGVVLYIIAVIRDLRLRKVLDDDVPEAQVQPPGGRKA